MDERRAANIQKLIADKVIAAHDDVSVAYIAALRALGYDGLAEEHRRSVWGVLTPPQVTLKTTRHGTPEREPLENRGLTVGSHGFPQGKGHLIPALRSCLWVGSCRCMMNAAPLSGCWTVEERNLRSGARRAVEPRVGQGGGDRAHHRRVGLCSPDRAGCGGLNGCGSALGAATGVRGAGAVVRPGSAAPVALARYGLPTVFLEADLPRVHCARHGVVIAAVPWARHAAGHPRPFGEMVAWFAACAPRSVIAELLRINRHTVGSILARVMPGRDAEDGDTRCALPMGDLRWGAEGEAARCPRRRHRRAQMRAAATHGRGAGKWRSLTFRT